jgi:Protein of unknown function (DUF3987)
MVKIDPAVAEKPATVRLNEKGELAARITIALWKGPALADACHAALQLGHLNAVNLLPYYRCRELLDANLELHKVNESHWPDAISIFHQGRDTIITRAEVWSRYFPALLADNDNEPEAHGPTSGDALSTLTNPGGLVGDLIDWIVSSSSRPSRELALSAVIPFVGALLGRRFASPTDLRTNFYTVALADSGYGKDHARTQLKRLITAAGLDRFSGPNRFMSATALRNSVMNKPSCLCMVDEFGGMMRQINDSRAGIHNVLIRSDMLEMFTSASTFFEGAAYAKESPQKIHSPNLCIYGTSTPDDFWASVSSLNTADGLLPRFMLFNVTGPKPDRIEPTRSVDDVPKALIEAVQALALAGRGSGNLAHNDHGSSASKPIAVPYSADAAAELARFEAVVEQTAATSGSAPILNRAVEHAIKLALTVSVAGNHKDITSHAMKWAVQLSWLSTCTMIEETSDRIADNQREADRNRIFGHVKRAGKDGITDGRIGDRCGSIDKRRRDELLSDLVSADRITEKLVLTKGRPRKRYFIA